MQSGSIIQAHGQQARQDVRLDAGMLGDHNYTDRPLSRSRSPSPRHSSVRDNFPSQLSPMTPPSRQAIRQYSSSRGDMEEEDPYLSAGTPTIQFNFRTPKAPPDRTSAASRSGSGYQNADQQIHIPPSRNGAAPFQPKGSRPLIRQYPGPSLNGTVGRGRSSPPRRVAAETYAPNPLQSQGQSRPAFDEEIYQSEDSDREEVNFPTQRLGRPRARQRSLKVVIPTYDGRGKWQTFLRQFENSKSKEMPLPPRFGQPGS